MSDFFASSPGPSSGPSKLGPSHCEAVLGPVPEGDSIAGTAGACRAPRVLEAPVNEWDSEWQRKEATLSDKTAREAFGLTQAEEFGEDSLS